MKKPLYIETSVWNQLEHDDRPEWHETAVRFMDTLKRGTYDPYISYVVVKEVEATKDPVRRKKLVEHINAVNPAMLEAEEDVETLVEKYLASAFPQNKSLRVYNDCSHVAVATVNGIHHLVSFNCDHLVSDRRIDGFNAINFQNGYDNVIDITTPHRFITPMTEQDDI